MRSRISKAKIVIPPCLRNNIKSFVEVLYKLQSQKIQYSMIKIAWFGEMCVGTTLLVGSLVSAKIRQSLKS